MHLVSPRNPAKVQQPTAFGQNRDMASRPGLFCAAMWNHCAARQRLQSANEDQQSAVEHLLSASQRRREYLQMADCEGMTYLNNSEGCEGECYPGILPDHNEHRYKALPGPGWIRVLTVQPYREHWNRDPSICALEQHQRRTDDDYTALSYS